MMKTLKKKILQHKFVKNKNLYFKCNHHFADLKYFSAFNQTIIKYTSTKYQKLINS